MRTGTFGLRESGRRQRVAGKPCCGADYMSLPLRARHAYEPACLEVEPGVLKALHEPRQPAERLHHIQEVEDVCVTNEDLYSSATSRTAFDYIFPRHIVHRCYCVRLQGRTPRKS